MREKKDSVNHPPHYTSHPSGVECIQVTEHMSFCLGNAIKYIWRADLKNDATEDLKKAAWYINREIDRRARNTETESLLVSRNTQSEGSAQPQSPPHSPHLSTPEPHQL